jgi:hypothetical protein
MVTNTPTKPIETSNQQAAIQILPIVTWLVANWPAILAVIGTAAYLIMNAGELVGGKKSDVYNAMNGNRQKKVDALKQDLDNAILREDSPGVVKALNQLSAEYKDAAKVLASSNPELAKKALDMAKGMDSLAAGAAKGKFKFTSREIGLNSDSSTLLASNNIVDLNNGVKIQSKDANLNVENLSSAQNLALATFPLPVVVQLIEKALKSLGQAVLNEKNAVKVAEVLLQTNLLTPDQIKNVFSQYYEHVQGLSPENSAEKAEKIVNEATNASRNKEENKPENVASVQNTPG